MTEDREKRSGKVHFFNSSFLLANCCALITLLAACGGAAPGDNGALSNPDAASNYAPAAVPATSGPEQAVPKPEQM